MNVLEKILEELENESQLAHEEMRRCARGNPLQFDEVKGYARAMEYVVDTIRSHMEKRKKVSRARIITRKIDEKSYYEIEYKETGKDEYDVGYGSYDLNNVIGWFNECFEFCGKTKVASDNDGWIPVEERLPEDDDMRFYMCIVENHEEDLPMFCQYDSEYGFGFWHDIYDSTSLGFVDTVFKTNDELGYEKVVAWQQLPKPYKAKEKS